MFKAKIFLFLPLKKHFLSNCASLNRLRHFISLQYNCNTKMNCFCTSTAPTSEEVELEHSCEPAADVSHSKLFFFTKFVRADKLEPQEKIIHNSHILALQAGEEIYKDPVTGYDVLTRLAHLRRGKCCGNACRHCPFGQQNVPKNIPKKKFNSAFYI